MRGPSPILPQCEYPVKDRLCGASAPHDWQGIYFCCAHFTEFMGDLASHLTIFNEKKYDELLEKLNKQIRKLRRES